MEKYPDDYVLAISILGELKHHHRFSTAGRCVCPPKRAVRLDPKQSQGHNMLGAAFSQVGRAREARDQFEQALRLDGANVNARYNLVFALVKAGRPARRKRSPAAGDRCISQ